MQASDGEERHGWPLGAASDPRTRPPRCDNACETCKRRKERCDGAQPCGRCTKRGVSGSCRFVERNNVTRRSQRPGRSVRARSHTVRDTASTARRLTAPSEPLFASQVSFTSPFSERSGVVTTSARNNGPHETSTVTPASDLESARMIQDPKGRFMFIGDSANLSFLQIIRRLVGDSIGPCPFVDDRLRYRMVEASPTHGTDDPPGSENSVPWLMKPPLDPAALGLTLVDATHLVRSYSLATDCVVDLFDEEELLRELPLWLENGGGGEQSSIPTPIFYLILAIGAQTSVDDRDTLATTLFSHGRQLAAQRFMDDASISTVQAFALITFYLLNAARRNAAFMYLGIAVRAGYALGLHRRDIASAFPSAEFQTRERVWKVMRILDLFMSASLGRPPATAETRDTEAQGADYSASNDLCFIFEKILTDVYSRRMVSTEALAHIGAHHRRWATHFHKGLATDRIEPHESLEGRNMPNIGLLHLKEAYYWTIMLLTRPFVIESIALHIKKSSSRPMGGPSEPQLCTATDSNKILVHACVDSAIRTIDLLSVLKDRRHIPKRLPFVVNSIFVAALVLGLAYFGDLYQVFPIEDHLKLAQQLLAQFKDDDISQRNSNIVEYLCEACKTYVKKRSAQMMDDQSMEVGSMFGQIHRRLRSHVPTRQPSPQMADASLPANVPGIRAHDREAGANLEFNERNPANIVEQPHDQSNIATEYPDIFDNCTDFTNLPFPVMSPRTLWFESFDANTPLFTIVNYADPLQQAS